MITTTTEAPSLEAIGQDWIVVGYRILPHAPAQMATWQYTFGPSKAAIAAFHHARDRGNIVTVQGPGAILYAKIAASQRLGGSKK
ncbi:MAG TPA: hypothetical protein VH024_17295 [Candidatus Angelobacter sp.]|jgi:hypothetical protein|nr:hypothetical protein [Candidatus Angelobacter sp.]